MKKITTGIEIEGNFLETDGTWKNLLVKMAEYLVEEGFLDQEDLPISIGRKRYIISKEPVHKHRDFIKAEELSNGFYLETNWSSSDTMRRIKDLAKLSGVEFEIKGYNDL